MEIVAIICSILSIIIMVKLLKIIIPFIVDIFEQEV